MEAESSRSAVELAIPFFIGLVTLEIIIAALGVKSVRKQKLRYEVKDAAASLTMGLGNTIIGGIVSIAVIGGVSYLQPYTLFDLGWSIPVLIVCFFLEDLTFYWSHRLSHEVRWFWASHVIHHSSQHYNLTTALRQNWTDLATGAALFYVPIVLIGFPIEMILMFRGASSVYQFWIHSEAIPKLGPFEWLFNTASHHRVHHSTNPEYLDRNHAGVLIIWDKLFGTFVEEDVNKPIRYGIVKNIGTFNPLRIAFHEWISMFKDVFQAKSLREGLGYLFGPPGWSIDGSRQTSEDIRREHRERLASGVAVPAE